MNPHPTHPILAALIALAAAGQSALFAVPYAQLTGTGDEFNGAGTVAFEVSYGGYIRAPKLVLTNMSLNFQAGFVDIFLWTTFSYPHVAPTLPGYPPGRIDGGNWAELEAGFHLGEPVSWIIEPSDSRWFYYEDPVGGRVYLWWDFDSRITLDFDGETVRGAGNWWYTSNPPISPVPDSPLGLAVVGAVFALLGGAYHMRRLPLTQATR